MTIDQLKYFICVCEERNITAAANRLCISQQGLSNSIQMLERELGHKLFRRSRAGAEPTEPALYLYQHLKISIAEMDQIFDDFKRIASTKQRNVRIVMGYGTMEHLGPEVFDPFLDRHPEISIHISDRMDSECFSEIDNRNADIALCVRPVDYDCRKYEMISLSTSGFAILANRAHPLSAFSSINITELAEYDILSAGSGFFAHDLFLSVCRENGFEPKIRQQVRELYMLPAMVEAGKGIALIVKGMFESYPLPANVIRIPINNEKLIWNLALFYRKDMSLSKEAVSVIKYCRENLCERP